MCGKCALLPRENGGKGVAPRIFRAWRICISCLFLTKDDLGKRTLTGCWQSLSRTVCAFSLLRGLRDAGWWLFIPSMILICGRTAAPGRSLAAGGTEEDVCHVSYGYGLFTGGPGLNGGSHKVGCLTLPMSSGNTDRQLQFMVDLGSTISVLYAVLCAFLAESIHERGLQDQIKFESRYLRRGGRGARRCGRIFRIKLRIKAYDIYGLTETSGPVWPLSAASRPVCISMKTTLLRRSSIRIRARFCRRAVRRAGVYLDHERGLSAAALPYQRHLRADKKEMFLRPYPCEDEQADGRSDDMLIVKGVECLPVPDRDGASGAGLSG